MKSVPTPRSATKPATTARVATARAAPAPASIKRPSIKPASARSSGTRRVIPLVVLCGAALVAGAASFYYLRFVRPMHQVGTAQAWTVLQTVEAEHRADADPNGTMLLPNADHSRYTLLGLPTGNARLPHAWIILDQWAPGSRMKMLPANAHIQVTCAYVEQVLKSAEVEPPVKSFLRSRCTPGSPAGR